MSLREHRCQSWRATPEPSHVPACLPGSCRRCWRPCLEVVPPGTVRCEDCLTAIAGHPSATVRALAAGDPHIPTAVLRDLAKDTDFAVAKTAHDELTARGEETFVAIEVTDLEEDTW